MRRKKAEEKVERLRESRLMRTNEELRRKCARWAEDNLEALEQADPSMPEAMNDREADCWRPLLAIADRICGDWPEQARAAAKALVKDNDDTSTGVQLLADIRTIFGTAEKLTSEVIVDELAKMEDRPWTEWSKGKPMSKAQLARQLGRFDIVPRTIRIGGQTAKGYDIIHGQVSNRRERTGLFVRLNTKEECQQLLRELAGLAAHPAAGAAGRATVARAAHDRRRGRPTRPRPARARL